MGTIQEIDEKIKKLKEEYRNPDTTVSRQKIIVLQGRALKIAREKLLKEKTSPTGQMKLTE